MKIEGLTLAEIRREAEREGDEFEGYGFRDVALIVIGLLDLLETTDLPTVDKRRDTPTKET